MKRSSVIWIVIALVVVAGGIIWVTTMASVPATPSYQPANANMIDNNPPTAVVPPTTNINTGMTNLPVGVLPPPSANTPNQSNVVLHMVSNSKLGNYLTGNNNMALYYFTNDSANTDTCTGTCAKVWPPYIVRTADQLSADGKVTGKIGMITLPNGSLQLTYNRAPLYEYSRDSIPTDVNGQGVGGVWFVQKP